MLITTTARAVLSTAPGYGYRNVCRVVYISFIYLGKGPEPKIHEENLLRYENIRLAVGEFPSEMAGKEA